MPSTHDFWLRFDFPVSNAAITGPLIFKNPEKVLIARETGEVPEILRALDQAAGEGYFAAGYLAYEAGFAFQVKGSWPQPACEEKEFPLAAFGLFRNFQTPGREDDVFDHAGGKTFVQPSGDTISQEEYLTHVERIREEIRLGRVYQVNYTFFRDLLWQGEPYELYLKLKELQPGYCSFFQWNSLACLSLSPELFFKTAAGRITMKPMKGTMARGANPEEDDLNRLALLQSEKDRAENGMIVDLIRNDLGRICRLGSVSLEKRFEIETHATLHQMTSTLTGRLKPNLSMAEIFSALFPCGSVTGAPKLAAMQSIERLEKKPRGVYTGSIGYITPNKDALFNVAIRTLQARNGNGNGNGNGGGDQRTASLGVGSGIVFDSVAGQEYDECILKSNFLFHAPNKPEPERRSKTGHAFAHNGFNSEPPGFALIETMLVYRGRIRFREGHLARARQSAKALGFRFDEERAAQLMLERSLESAGKCKLRLLFHPGGAIDFEMTSLAKGFGGRAAPLQVCIAPERVDSGDALLGHKTTRRSFPDQARADALERGCQEVIFLNERGEATECCHYNLLARFGETWVTPPVTAGLLPGLMRGHLIQKKRVMERTLSVNDLARADEIALCNSVRGVCRAILNFDSSSLCRAPVT